MSINILLLEDDALLADSLEDLLECEGYEVSHYSNGQLALDATFEQKFDLYLLDINVPLIGGLDFLRELRASGDETPAIFLTSYQDKETLQQGFLSGCDDYLCKPFDNDELLLRIAARLRRQMAQQELCVGSFVHDAVSQRVIYKERELELSKKEYELLVLFMQNVNKVLPKDVILDALWSASEGSSDGALRVYVNRLKHELPEGSIENIRGIGYKFVL